MGRVREQALAETFVMLADTLVDDYDVVDLLDELATACVSLLEVFQLQNNEGPCLQCVQTGKAVISADLGADQARWPLFVPVALRAGFLSVAALPLRLRLREQTIGGLNLFHNRAEPVSDSDRRLAQALADVATIGILQQRSAHRNAQLAEQLQLALNSRVAIEQAKGVLAQHHGVPMTTAFEALRGHAREHNIKLTDLATAIVHGNLSPSVITARQDIP